MATVTIPLEHGKFYHIYNRGINSCNLFSQPVDYEHFLHLYEKYISVVADTYAWVLMPNHFHLLVRIKDEGEILPFGKVPLPGSSTASRVSEPGSSTASRVSEPGSSTTQRDKEERKPIPSHQLGHLFNAYCQHYNARYGRHGSLFEHQFRRKVVDSEEYFTQLVVYIHNNPVHHGFCKHPLEYPWSSYITCISSKPTHLQREGVIGWFNNTGNFVALHNRAVDTDSISHLIIE